MNHYSRLTHEQRHTFDATKCNGASQKEVAAAIVKQPSTESRIAPGNNDCQHRVEG